MHRDFVDQRNARVPFARLLDAQCPPEVHNWKNGLDRAAELLADALRTYYCTLEEAVRILVVDIGSLAWRKLIVQLIGPVLGPVLERLAQPFVYS